MHTNLAGYQSPLQRSKHRLPYISDSVQYAAPPSAPTPQTDDHKLNKIMKNAHEVLAKADTVFPFTLFKDTIIVDRSKVTVIKRNFFMMAETFSIRVEDILNVSTTVGPFFGSIQIVSRVFNTDKPHVINFLWRDDAVKIKHLIHGYVIATHNDIDCDSLSKGELLAMLAKLGHEENV